GAQEGVDVIDAGWAHGGGLGPCNDGQVGGDGTKPFLGVGRRHGDVHEVANLVGGEQQVLFDLFVGQADFGELVIAHGVGAMATEAIVDEQFGAVLQRSHVVDAIGRGVELVTTAGGERHRAGQ